MSVMPEIAPVFIVGTGRCGSTMLSNMLREHPNVLSLSEFLVIIADFGARISQAFPEAPIDADRVWSIIAGCHPRQTMLLRKHCDIDEMIYPLTPESRFGRETGVPAVLFAALPHLTSQHDALFDELHAFVMTLEPAPAMRQYECIFEWLRKRFSRRVWVEHQADHCAPCRLLRRHFRRPDLSISFATGEIVPSR